MCEDFGPSLDVKDNGTVRRLNVRTDGVGERGQDLDTSASEQSVYRGVLTSPSELESLIFLPCSIRSNASKLPA